jgi:hypothetical protein
MGEVSQKKVLIDKASKRVVIVTCVAAFVVVFSAVASQSLFSQMLYQNRVVSAKKDALSQLEKNKQAVDKLDSSYAAFVNNPQNVIGGSSNGDGSQDGDNSKIILDALPSKYDFPALATSLEKLLTSQNIDIQNIGGIDEELAQGTPTVSGKPVPLPIPFQLSAQGNYQTVQNLIKTFEASIRPIQIQTMSLSGNNTNVTIDIAAQTYYQPAKSFTIGKKVIK